MQLRDVMHEGVTAIYCERSIPDLETVLLNDHISGVPVISVSGKLMGIVSKTDLIRKYQQMLRLGASTSRKELSNIKVYEIMSPNVFTASPEEDLSTVARKMVESGYHRVIVTNEKNEILGIVSSLDVLRAVGRGYLLQES